MFELDTPDIPFDIPKTVGIEFLGLLAMMLILSRLERFGLVFCSKLYFLSAFSFHRLKQLQRKYPIFLQKMSFKVLIYKRNPAFIAKARSKVIAAALSLLCCPFVVIENPSGSIVWL